MCIAAAHKLHHCIAVHKLHCGGIHSVMHLVCTTRGTPVNVTRGEMSGNGRKLLLVIYHGDLKKNDSLSATLESLYMK